MCIQQTIIILNFKGHYTGKCMFYGYHENNSACLADSGWENSESRCHSVKVSNDR